MPDQPLEATIHTDIGDIASADWDALIPKQDDKVISPFSKHAFLSALEQSGSATADTGWLPQHIILSQDDEIVGAMPLYLKNHSQGEYVFDYAWADAYERAGGNYYPKFQCSIPFTPASSPKLLAKNNNPQFKHALLQAAQTRADQIDASSVHATFLDENDCALAEQTGWLTRTDTQFHWANQNYSSFDDFLSALASRKRKALKKERRAIAEQGIDIVWKRGSEISEDDWDRFFEFYMDTGSRKWGHPYLTRSFFSIIGETMVDDAVLMFAYDGPDCIAGTLNFVGADTLFGRYWGCTRHVPFLHFELCYYQAIDFAIENGLRIVEAGAQGEHKLARGYAPTETRSAHWIAHPGLRNAIADYLIQERDMVQRGQNALNLHVPFKKGD